MATCVDITEQKKSQAELQKTDQWLRLALRSAKQGIYDLNIKTGEVKLSEDYADLLGYDSLAPSFQTKFLDENIHPDDRERATEIYQAYLKGDLEQYRAEFRLRTKTGGWKWVLSLGKIVSSGANGEPLRMIGTHTDISSIKETEYALRAIEQRLNAILLGAPVLLFGVDRQGLITYSTGKALQSTGLKPNQNVGVSFFELYKNVPGASENMNRALNGETVQFAIEAGPYCFEAFYIPDVNERGVVTGVIGMGLDVTERKRAAQNLEKKNRELKEVIDAIDRSSLVSMTDQNGIIVKVNKRFCEISGYTEAELIGQSHRLISSGYHSPVFWEEFWSTIRSGSTWHGIIRNKTKTGSYYWVDTTVNPIANEQGEVTHFLSIRQDITDLIQSRGKLEESEERLQQIISVTGIGVFDHDQINNTIYWSPELIAIFGFAPNEVITLEKYFSHVHPEDRDFIANEVKRAHSAGGDGSFNVTHRIQDTQGNQKWIKIRSATHFLENDGKRIAIRTIGAMEDVTDRVIAQNRLRESEFKFRSLFELSPLGIAMNDFKTGAFLECNDAVFKPTGYTRDEFLALTYWEITPRKYENEEALQLDLLLKTGYYGPFEKEYIKKDGTTYPVLLHGFRLIDLEGREIIWSVVQDMSDRERAEKALLESEATLRKAQEVAKLGSWRMNMKTRTIEWSDEACRIINSPVGKVTRADFSKYIHSDDRDRVTAEWTMAIKGQPYNVVYRIVVEDKIKWIHERTEPTLADDGSVVLMVGTIQDITAQKVLQDANLIFNQSQLLTGVGSWRASIVNNELFWSDSVYQLHGLDESEGFITFKRYLEAVHPQDRKRVRQTLEETIYAKQTFETEYRVPLPEGMRWLSLKGQVLFDQQDLPIEVYGIVRDITVEKRNTEELVAARKQAEEASVIKDEFLSVMSHEIRTPLNSVIGLSNLLVRRNPREDQVEVIKTLKNSADNLMHLVNDILDFNKIRSGKVKLEVIEFNLHELLRQHYASVVALTHDKGLELKFQIDPEVPPVILGDVTRLNQILTNLLSNAIKFTHHGSVKLKTSLVARIGNRYTISFAVSDTGVGIPASKHETIFQPFHQSEAHTARKFGGTGLGLSIVKSLVELKGGTIQVDSVPGQGSTFTVTLGFKTKAKAPEEAKAEPAIYRDEKPGSSPDSPFVLYVEDVESNRFLIENLLRDAGIHCTAVSSGRAALKFTALKKFDVILMDLQMPGLDGYETSTRILKQVRGKNRTTPIIAFTAEAYSATLKEKTLQHQIPYVISKPFDPEKLIEKIRLYATPNRPEKPWYSFSFYDKAFGDVKVKNKIRKAIVRDLQRFKRGVEKHSEKRNLEGLRKEAHRIRPIIKNLAMDSLLLELDKIREHDFYNKDVGKSVTQIRRLVDRLTKTIEKLDLSKNKL